MSERLVWDLDGHDWPHRTASRFVQAAGLRWHVQQHRCAQPAAPSILLLHGTGASSHSWRDLVLPLAQHTDVLAVDLPGHGFSAMPRDASLLSLPGMATAVSALLQEIGVQPTAIVGHSAGAAVGVRMCLVASRPPAVLIGINAALLPLAGWAGSLFSPLARLLAFNPWVPRLFARRAADPAVLRRLLDGTGSTLDAQGRAWYARLVGNPGHVAGALAMMARWDLAALARDLHRLRVPLHLLVGENDRTVPPDQARQVQLRVPRCTVTHLAGLGHLAHEERPHEVATRLLAIIADPPSAGFTLVRSSVVNST